MRKYIISFGYIAFIILNLHSFNSSSQSETEPNGSNTQSGTITIANQGTITGDVCLGGGCPSADPTDFWIIDNGVGGNFIATWTDNVVITLRNYGTDDTRGSVPANTVLSSGVSQTLSASNFYSISIQFSAIAVFTSYSVSITGTALPPLVSVPTTATVATTVFLQGAYNGTNLNTTLNSSIPTVQPYSGSAFNNHTGMESATAPAGAVDWVLVELREATTAATANNGAKVGSAAGFLMSDGRIKATNGTDDLTVSLSGNSGAEFFVVIYHRNHLPIMSANAISESGSAYTIDFTTSSSNTYQGTSALSSLAGSKFGMVAGDQNSDGQVNSTDLTNWRVQNGGAFNYTGSSADFNLDGQVNAVDRNDYQQPNSGKSRQVPFN